MADLAQHFIHPHIGTHVARAIVAGEKQLQFVAGLPRFISAQHPSRFRALDVGTDPGLQHEVHHAAVPPAAAGQGWY